MNVYLASPFFNDKQREVKNNIRAKLWNLGVTVLDPQPISKNYTGWERPNHIWAKDTFDKDIDKILAADAIVAIDWGMDSDAGTAWEVGFAYGLAKKVLVISPMEVLNNLHSLMIVNGSKNFISENRFLDLTPEQFKTCFEDKTITAIGVVQG